MWKGAGLARWPGLHIGLRSGQWLRLGSRHGLGPGHGLRPHWHRRFVPLFPSIPLVLPAFPLIFPSLLPVLPALGAGLSPFLPVLPALGADLPTFLPALRAGLPPFLPVDDATRTFRPGFTQRRGLKTNPQDQQKCGFTKNGTKKHKVLPAGANDLDSRIGLIRHCSQNFTDAKQQRSIARLRQRCANGTKCRAEAGDAGPAYLLFKVLMYFPTSSASCSVPANGGMRSR